MLISGIIEWYNSFDSLSVNVSLELKELVYIDDILNQSTLK